MCWTCKSSAALVINLQNGERPLFATRTSTAVAPIASITKLMTAMVVLDAEAAAGRTHYAERRRP